MITNFLLSSDIFNANSTNFYSEAQAGGRLSVCQTEISNILLDSSEFSLKYGEADNEEIVLVVQE